MRTNDENTEVADKAAPDAADAAANADSTKATDAGEGKGQGEAKGEEAGKAEGETDTGKGEGDGKDKPDDAPKGAPEKYEAFNLSGDYVLEGDRLTMAHDFAKANDWTQEQAQQGVETYIKFRAAEREHERGLWGAQSEEEFGKDFDGIAKGAQRAIVALETARPGITDRLDATNLGNHPDVLYVFNELGKHLKPKPLDGMESEGAAPQPKSREERLWPSKT